MKFFLIFCMTTGFTRDFDKRKTWSHSLTIWNKLREWKNKPPATEQFNALFLVEAWPKIHFSSIKIVFLLCIGNVSGWKLEKKKRRDLFKMEMNTLGHLNKKFSFSPENTTIFFQLLFERYHTSYAIVLNVSQRNTQIERLKNWPKQKRIVHHSRKLVEKKKTKLTK